MIRPYLLKVKNLRMLCLIKPFLYDSGDILVCTLRRIISWSTQIHKSLGTLSLIELGRPIVHCPVQLLCLLYVRGAANELKRSVNRPILTFNLKNWARNLLHKLEMKLVHPKPINWLEIYSNGGELQRTRSTKLPLLGHAHYWGKLKFIAIYCQYSLYIVTLLVNIIRTILYVY